MTHPLIAHRRALGAMVAVAVAIAALALGFVLSASVANDQSATEATEVTAVTDVTAASGLAGNLTVTLLDPEPDAGVRDIEVRLTDSGGLPVTDAAIVASATMPEMGHSGEVSVGSPTPGKRAKDGVYQLTGDLFPMPGRWSVRVEIERDGASSTATMPLVVTTP